MDKTFSELKNKLKLNYYTIFHILIKTYNIEELLNIIYYIIAISSTFKNLNDSKLKILFRYLIYDLNLFNDEEHKIIYLKKYSYLINKLYIDNKSIQELRIILNSNYYLLIDKYIELFYKYESDKKIKNIINEIEITDDTIVFLNKKLTKNYEKNYEKNRKKYLNLLRIKEETKKIEQNRKNVERIHAQIKKENEENAEYVLVNNSNMKSPNQIRRNNKNKIRIANQTKINANMKNAKAKAAIANAKRANINAMKAIAEAQKANVKLANEANTKRANMNANEEIYFNAQESFPVVAVANNL